MKKTGYRCIMLLVMSLSMVGLFAGSSQYQKMTGLLGPKSAYAVLIDTNVFTSASNVRRQTGSLQYLEFHDAPSVPGQALTLITGPKDATGKALLFKDGVVISFDPCYREFYQEHEIPAYLYATSLPQEAITEVSEDTIVMFDGRQVVQVQVSLSGYRVLYLIDPRTSLPLLREVRREDDVLLDRTEYLEFMDVDDGTFYPKRMKQWTVLYPRVEQEHDVVGVRPMTFGPEVFTQEYIQSIVTDPQDE